jgi:hypothetical protein
MAVINLLALAVLLTIAVIGTTEAQQDAGSALQRHQRRQMESLERYRCQPKLIIKMQCA